MRLLVAAAAILLTGLLAWTLLSGPSAREEFESTGARGERATPGPTATVDPGSLATVPAPTEPLDDDAPAPEGWQRAPLPLAPRGGPVTGQELLDAVEKANLLVLRFESPADREALRSLRFPEHPRDALTRAMIEPLLLEAGFQVDGVGRVRHVRRAPREEPEGPRDR